MPYDTDMFCRVSLLLRLLIIFGRKNKRGLLILAILRSGGFFSLFSLEFLQCIAEKTMVFIDVPANGIQQEFFIYLGRRTMMESAEVIVFLDISKMSFCLNGADLAVQDPFSLWMLAFDCSFNPSHRSLIFITLFLSASFSGSYL